MQRPETSNALHRKFVLRRKRNQEGKIHECNAMFLVSDNEEANDDTKYFSSVVDYMIIKLLLCWLIQLSET